MASQDASQRLLTDSDCLLAIAGPPFFARALRAGPLAASASRFAREAF
jgi:hypothetical protein